jgi:class 3 adenylate cyclase/tetratricopeptide (TPR) repeat protein
MVSAAAVRKTVTVVFCDLAGSTALGERLDPEPLRLLLSRWYEAMRDPVERHGGTVEKFIGDAVMAVFGIPQVHEDDALRAVRAAVEMRDAAAALGDGLAVRIGVNTGEVVSGDEGTTLVTGDAVNTAKRLEEAAAAGEILIGEPTRRLVENAAELEAVEPVVAKGKRRPVPVWRLLATIPDVPAVARRLDAPLVGRRDELALLRAELERAERERACRLVTILGPAGIGKSRLATELLAAARDGGTVLVGRCPPYGDGITFLPLHDLVRSAGGEEGVAAAVAAEPDGRLIVERLGDARLAHGDEQVSSEEVFWAVRRTLEALARERPLVVCLEDVHWASPTFLDLVEYVLGWSRDAPILLLCLARPDLLDARPRWPGAVVELEALSDADATALLGELAAEWPLGPEARLRAVEIAEGNPLYLEQLVAMLAAGEDTGRLPPTIHALLAARLDRLPPADRAVLERAAVVGREFPRGAVVELSPEEERTGIGTTLLRLVREQLVDPQPSGDGDDGLRFRHALIRDAAYAGLTKSARAGLHERVSARLERTGGDPALVAYHLEQAHLYGTELGLPGAAAAGARAAELLAEAGRQAFARNDAPAAANLLQRASALLAEDDRAQLEVLRLAGLALFWSGDVERARGVLARQIERAREHGDAVEEWSGRLDVASIELVTGGADAEALLRVAEQAIDALGPGDNAALARAWRRVAHGHCASGRYGLAAQASERALEHARTASEEFEEARVVDVFCTSLLYGPTHVDEAVGHCERLLREAAGNPAQEANVSASLAGLLAMRGDFERARERVGFALTRFEELGQRLALAGTTQIAGPLELLAGDPEAAERELRRGLDVFGPDGSDGYQEGLLAEALYRLGRMDEAALLADAGAERANPADAVAQVTWRLVRAKLLGERDPGAAVVLAREAVALAESTDAVNLVADALADLALLAAASGDEQAAAEASRRALALYEQKGNAAAAGRLAAGGAGERVGSPRLQAAREE